MSRVVHATVPILTHRKIDWNRDGSACGWEQKRYRRVLSGARVFSDLPCIGIVVARGACHREGWM